jgi:hypothetical protein
MFSEFDIVISAGNNLNRFDRQTNNGIDGNLWRLHADRLYLFQTQFNIVS